MASIEGVGSALSECHAFILYHVLGIFAMEKFVNFWKLFVKLCGMQKCTHENFVHEIL